MGCIPSKIDVVETSKGSQVIISSVRKSDNTKIEENGVPISQNKENGGKTSKAELGNVNEQIYKMEDQNQTQSHTTTVNKDGKECPKNEEQNEESEKDDSDDKESEAENNSEGEEGEKRKKEKKAPLTAEEKEKKREANLLSLQKYLEMLANRDEYKEEDGSFNKTLRNACLQIFKLHLSIKRVSRKEFDHILDSIIDRMDAGDLYSEDGKPKPGIWLPLVNLTAAIMNFTDRNPDLTHQVVEHPKYLDRLVEYIQQNQQPYLDKQLKLKERKILSSFFDVIHNIAQAESHIERLRNLGLVDICLPFLNAENEKMVMINLATLADLVDESEAQKIEANPEFLKFLLSGFSKSMKAKRHRYLGWSSRELARAIRRLGRNDTNKKSLVKYGSLPLLVELSGMKDIQEQKEAVAALRTLAFDEENQDIMINGSDGVIEVFITHHSSPEKDIRNSCNGALWTLRNKLAECEKYKELGKKFCSKGEIEQGNRGIYKGDDGQDNQKGHVMISYQWGHQTLVREICLALRENNIKVWMDIDDMEGSTLNAMARAVEEAKIVLICFSQKYKDSDNCRAEAEYAFQTKKKIIPIKVENQYRPDGWLGFIIGSKLFYDFGGKYSFESRLDGLVKEIFKSLSRSIPSDIVVPHKVQLATIQPQAPKALHAPSKVHTSGRVAVKADMAVKNWTSNEVTKWLNKHELSSSKVQKITGIEIAYLQVMKQESPESYYRTIHDIMKINDLLTAAKLTFALEDTLIS